MRGSPPHDGGRERSPWPGSHPDPRLTRRLPARRGNPGGDSATDGPQRVAIQAARGGPGGLPRAWPFAMATARRPGSRRPRMAGRLILTPGLESANVRGHEATQWSLEKARERAPGSTTRPGRRIPPPARGDRTCPEERETGTQPDGRSRRRRPIGKPDSTVGTARQEDYERGHDAGEDSTAAWLASGAGEPAIRGWNSSIRRKSDWQVPTWQKDRWF